jgi:hypothetical protein
MNQIVKKIEDMLQIPGTSYFNVSGQNDTTIKIRVSDHSMNRHNNGDQITLSFVSQRTAQRKSAYNASHNEWVILENGLTDTYEEIADILANNGVTDTLNILK